MSRDILQRFLGRKLFDVGAEDTRLDRLRMAANDLGARLLESPPLAVRYALVAFDPNVPVTEPTLDEVAAAVERHWNTYASCFADTPRTAFRAVLLAALEQAVGKSTGIAAAVALSARNLLPHLDLGAEADVWADLIEAADGRLEERARAEWTVAVDQESGAGIQVNLAVGASEPAPKTDRAALTQAFFAASGPQNSQGQAIANSNQYAPNQGQAWSNEFAPRAAQAVAEAIDKAVSAALRSRSGFEQALSEAVEVAVSDALTGVHQATRGLRRRSELLWWKEALYSPSQNVGYRSLSPVGAAALMALDLNHQVPPFCPGSVEFFLREAVGVVVGADGGSSGAKPLKKLVSELTANSPPEAVRMALAGFRQTSGRGPLISLVADLIEGGRSSPDRFISSVGVTGETKFTLPDLAVWLFRELQAAAALAAELPVPPVTEQGPESEDEA